MSSENMLQLHARLAKVTEELAALKEKTRCAIGVGDGSGNLIVYGTYDSVKAVQAMVLRLESAEKELAKLQAAQTGEPK